MKKTLLTVALLGLLGLVGCKQPVATDDHPISPDVNSASIAEAPVPTVAPETYEATGILADSRGQFEPAARFYQKALEAKPNNLSLTKRIALCYTKLGDNAKAELWWKRYMEVSHQSADAFGCMGYAHELAGNPLAAEKTYQDGIAKYPNSALIQTNYGLMLVRQSKVDAGLSHLTTVLKPAEANYNVGSTFEQMGRKDLAQFYYKRAIELDPGFSPAKTKLAMIE